MGRAKILPGLGRTLLIARRLDYIFCDSISSFTVVKSFSKVISGTDHKALISEFEKKIEFKRGPSTWKFNTSYLKDL